MKSALQNVPNRLNITLQVIGTVNLKMPLIQYSNFQSSEHECYLWDANDFPMIKDISFVLIKFKTLYKSRHAGTCNGDFCFCFSGFHFNFQVAMGIFLRVKILPLSLKGGLLRVHNIF